jgi:hypothetical protein
MEIVFHSAARGGEASAPPSFLSQVPLVRPLPADSLPCTAGAGFCAYGPAINRSKPTAQITALHPAQPSFSPALARPARSRGGRAPPPALSTSKHAARSEKKNTYARAPAASTHARTLLPQLPALPPTKRASALHRPVSTATFAWIGPGGNAAAAHGAGLLGRAADALRAAGAEPQPLRRGRLPRLRAILPRRRPPLPPRPLPLPRARPPLGLVIHRQVPPA